jgi:4-diphosphocytidyl-2-C-methyl-D-erythritol kinase
MYIYTEFFLFMIVFAQAKINVGLQVISKRDDGYHDIETMLVPIGLCDILEVHPSETHEFRFSWSGIPSGVPTRRNLVFKAWKILQDDYLLTGVRVHLHKQIPPGSGLGGGSSDAAAMLQSLNSVFSLNLSPGQLSNYAIRIGSDCPFFLHKKALLAHGRGEILSEPIKQINGFYLMIAFTGIHSSTARAYQEINCFAVNRRLDEIIQADPAMWKKELRNDFEVVILKQFPILQEIKDSFYKSNAFYASLTGSGSAVYAMFTCKPKLQASMTSLIIWEGWI